jgi:hypothetical protein
MDIGGWLRSLSLEDPLRRLGGSTTVSRWVFSAGDAQRYNSVALVASISFAATAKENLL